jgi:hypothetical protein
VFLGVCIDQLVILAMCWIFEFLCNLMVMQNLCMFTGLYKICVYIA